MSDVYILIIDTDSYSGNFERAMCAYLTGKAFDGYDEYIDLFCKEMDVEDAFDYNDHILFLPGEFGETPVTVWPTPGWFNDGHGNHFQDIYPYDKNEQHNEDRYPAYQSVGIFMDRKPTDEEIETLKERANKFQCLEGHKETPKILGFRLIQRKTIETEVPL